MNGGLIRFCLAAAIGGFLAWVTPREGLLATTQELIGFLSLLMAGLLPAMILTATILRGTGMSARRVDGYGIALQKQLSFWAVLFTCAGIATISIVVAKICGTPNVNFKWSWRFLSVDAWSVGTIAWIVAGSAIGVVMQRLWPAYRGLVSLLELNVMMAKGDALVADRTRIDSLADDARELVRMGPTR